MHVVCILLLVLSSNHCRHPEPHRSNATDAEYATITVGMTRDHTEKILGAPTATLDRLALKKEHSKAECVNSAQEALVYHREPPATSFLILLDSDGRVRCKTQAVEIIAY